MKVNYKIIEDYEHKGKRILITGRFYKDYYDGWDYYGDFDAVKLLAEIREVDDESEITSRDSFSVICYEGTRKYKTGLFKKSKAHYTLHQDVLYQIAKLKSECEELIDEDSYDQEITDGIPDSLKSL